MTASDGSLEAGRLLALALDATASPGSAGASADYANLVERYLQDAPFRALFDGLVEGVGCSVAAVDRSVGVVLRTRQDGPWAFPSRGADLPWRSSFDSADMRAARALVPMGVLAYVAPTAADLDDVLADPDLILPNVGVRELERFIRDFCDQMEAETVDPAHAHARPLWWHWLQLPAEAPTPKRAARGTTTYLVYEVLSFLNGLGLLVELGSNRAVSAKQYRPRRRFLYHYRDLALDDVFTGLQRHAANARVGEPTARVGDRPRLSVPPEVKPGDSES